VCVTVCVHKIHTKLSRRETEYITRLQSPSALPWGHEMSHRKTSQNKGGGFKIFMDGMQEQIGEQYLGVILQYLGVINVLC
jgi:hypothetical protein